MEQLTEEYLYAVIRPRPQQAHKGDFGRVVLIGGNETYGGAIIMSAEAAVKSGTGLVSVVTSKKNHSPLHARLPEAMVLDWDKEQEIIDLIETANVVLIGSGLGLNDHAASLLSLVLTRQKKQQWLVIDGSAITLFSEKKYLLKYPETVVFTPHQMEWQRLSNINISKQNQTINQTIQLHLGATVVLKSHRTEIYSAKAVYQNPIGTPAMATGGMGDTLAGIITGFLAQFPDKEAAICGAVYLHSLIGEVLGAKCFVVLPTEISQLLPVYMKKYERVTPEANTEYISKNE